MVTNDQELMPLQLLKEQGSWPKSHRTRFSAGGQSRALGTWSPLCGFSASFRQGGLGWECEQRLLSADSTQGCT